MLLARLKIRTRVYAGFGSLIVLGLAVAAVGSWGIDGMGRQTSRMTGLVGNIRYVARAIEGQERIARALLQASIEPDETLQPRFEKAQADVRDALTQASAKTTSPVRKEIYEGSLAKLDAQAQSANKSFDVGRKMAAERKKLFSGGDAMTAATNRLVEVTAKSDSPELIAAGSGVERAILLVRIANWRFLATNDPKGPTTFHTNTTRAQEMLDALDKLNAPGLADHSTAVREKLIAYQTAFDATAPALIEMQNAFDKVQLPFIEAMQAELVRADESLAKDTTDAAAVAASLRDTTSVTQSIVAGIGLIGGLALAFLIGRSIIRPIAGITRTMGLLADGRHDVEVAGADSRDEIGDMARAVEVFKQNAIAKDTLEEQQARAQAAQARRQEEINQLVGFFGRSVGGVFATLAEASANMTKSSAALEKAATDTNTQASIGTQRG